MALNGGFAILCQIIKSFKSGVHGLLILFEHGLGKQVHSQRLIKVSDLGVHLIEGGKVCIHAPCQLLYQAVHPLKLLDSPVLLCTEVKLLLHFFHFLL